MDEQESQLSSPYLDDLINRVAPAAGSGYAREDQAVLHTLKSNMPNAGVRPVVDSADLDHPSHLHEERMGDPCQTGLSWEQTEQQPLLEEEDIADGFISMQNFHFGQQMQGDAEESKMDEIFQPAAPQETPIAEEEEPVFFQPQEMPMVEEEEPVPFHPNNIHLEPEPPTGSRREQTHEIIQVSADQIAAQGMDLQGASHSVDVPQPEEEEPEYIKPPIEILNEIEKPNESNLQEELRTNAEKLVSTLQSFGVQTRIIDIARGPAVTRYELQPSAVSSYPVLHMLAAVPIFPWYTIELFCIYLVTWLIVVLQNRICRPGFLPAAISNGVGAAFLVYAFVYGMMASHLSLGAILFFSASVFCYKVASALYLLIIAVLAIHRGEKRSSPIFYAAAAATCAFIWDRLLPVYEPVIGGWFVEWGSFFIAAAIGYSLWRDVVEGYGNSLIFQEERKQVVRQLSMQTEYSRQVSEAAAENRRLIHDIKHHLRTIDRMASERGQTEICSFLLQVEEQVAATSGHSPAQFCKNPVVNALIEYYYGMAQTQGTEFQVRLDLPDQMPLTDVELCTVLGNLLDNAVEACSRQKQGVRRIFIAGETRGNMYFLKIENTYDGLALQEGKTFLSRKGTSADHGIGLSSVRKIIEGHGGDLDLVPGEESFLVGITIQM